MLMDVVNNKWRYLTVDKERKIDRKDNKYTLFQSVLNDIYEPNLAEKFPRPLNKTIPIPSFGIIAIYDDSDTNSLSYFATQRRTTVEFSEFIRCGPRKEFLYEYLCNMSQKERQLTLDIASDPNLFHKVWQDFVMDETPLYIKSEQKTRQIFDAYVSKLPELLELTTSDVEDPPWGFPKGREKVGDHTRLQSALREMEEEGKLFFDNVKLAHPDPITEVSKGTDGCLYSTTYYIVKCDKMYMPEITYLDDNTLDNKCLSLEMRNYMWLTFDKSQKIATNSTVLPNKLESLLIRLHDKLR